MAKLRKIVVADQRYEWTSRRGQDERVTAWAEGTRAGFVAIAFTPAGRRPQDGSVMPGIHAQFLDPSQGFVHSGLRLYNLNRPAVAADLIRAALARGWAPLAGRPLHLDGFALLRDPDLAFTPERFVPDERERATQLIEGQAAAAGQAPITWLAARSPTRWTELFRLGPGEFLLAAAGLVALDLLLDAAAPLDPSQRSALAVWADEQQVQGRPGGLTVAHWLADANVADPAAREDLERWVATLLDQG